MPVTVQTTWQKLTEELQWFQEVGDEEELRLLVAPNGLRIAGPVLHGQRPIATWGDFSSPSQTPPPSYFLEAQTLRRMLRTFSPTTPVVPATIVYLTYTQRHSGGQGVLHMTSGG